MPAYAQINNFMNLVRAANPQFERVLNSSLRPLINVLNNVAGTGVQVCTAIAALPADKVKRYLDPLYYLLSTYPGLPANAATNLHMGALDKTNAALYQTTPRPPNFNPSGPVNARVFVTPPSAFANLTLEQYILGNRATTGVLLIHLSSPQPGMDSLFNGRSTITHIKSVLRTARLTGCPVCALTMEANSDVCPFLRPEYNQIHNPIRVYEPHTHMGGNHLAFRNFAASRANIVVMGFDANVCVFANVFGSMETMPDGSFKPALVSMGNVVMSRAGLVGTGGVSSNTPTFGQAEYGPLFNT
jgi:hypothetical protein